MWTRRPFARRSRRASHVRELSFSDLRCAVGWAVGIEQLLRLVLRPPAAFDPTRRRDWGWPRDSVPLRRGAEVQHEHTEHVTAAPDAVFAAISDVGNLRGSSRRSPRRDRRTATACRSTPGMRGVSSTEGVVPCRPGRAPDRVELGKRLSRMDERGPRRRGLSPHAVPRYAAQHRARPRHRRNARRDPHAGRVRGLTCRTLPLGRPRRSGRPLPGARSRGREMPRRRRHSAGGIRHDRGEAIDARAMLNLPSGCPKARVGTGTRPGARRKASEPAAAPLGPVGAR